MFSHRSLKSLLKNGVFVLLGMVLAALLFTILVPANSPEAHAAPAALPNQVPSNPEGVTATWVSCVPVGVATFSQRVHVECASAIGGIRFFATPTDNPAHVARILSTLSAAQVAGRTLNVLYEPSDTSGTSFGCQASDCRILLAAGFGQ